MGLLDRARKKASEQDDQENARRQQADRRTRNELVPMILRVLELDVDDIKPDDLTVLPPGEERPLCSFEYEGMSFVAGVYWTGNPSTCGLIAVKTGRAKGNPTWPPPHPASASNTGWAPGGYTAITGLASLARAFPASEGDE